LLRGKKGTVCRDEAKAHTVHIKYDIVVPHEVCHQNSKRSMYLSVATRSRYDCGGMFTTAPSAKWNARVGSEARRVAGILIRAVEYCSLADASAFINAPSTERGRHVSVVPLSTMMPFPELYLDDGSPMLRPATVMSRSVTVNQPEQAACRRCYLCAATYSPHRESFHHHRS
jgi:hypothetical protein